MAFPLRTVALDLRALRLWHSCGSRDLLAKMTLDAMASEGAAKTVETALAQLVSIKTNPIFDFSSKDCQQVVEIGLQDVSFLSRSMYVPSKNIPATDAFLVALAALLEDKP